MSMVSCLFSLLTADSELKPASNSAREVLKVTSFANFSLSSLSYRFFSVATTLWNNNSLNH